MNPIWTPSHPEQSRMAQFKDWVERNYQVTLKDYEALHRWSITHPSEFWWTVAQYFNFPFTTPPQHIVQSKTHLWETTWFEGATFNYADALLRGQPEHVALIGLNENNERRTLTYRELKTAVIEAAAGLQAIGIKPGDRVAAVLPNTIETIIAFLASAAVGAIWSSCSPDFGVPAVIDRFSQITPKILFLADGQTYAGKTYENLEKLPALLKGLPSLEKVIVCPVLGIIPPTSPQIMAWKTLLKSQKLFSFISLPFSHPLYILFSSGTTGKPKCIIHGAGNALIQHLKELGLHSNLSEKDNLCFYTTCSWMMWNWMVSGLALGMTLTLYDGSPAYPDPLRLFSLVEAEKITALGLGAKLLASIEKTNLNMPGKLESLKLLLSTGSPLLPAQYDFVYQKVKKDLQLSSISGGTDIVSCFALGNPMLPVYRGELQCIGLGMDVQVFNSEGKTVREEQGELVCLNAFPSMPLGFWNDPFKERYQHTYFERFPHVWTHGDFAATTPHHGLIIYGRSDTTLKRGGVRIGSAEIYRQVEDLPEILESVVVGLPWKDDIRLILFVQLKAGHTLTEALQHTICERLRKNASPRHVPQLILEVPDIPKTLNGKVVELAILQTLEGRPIQNLSSIANPEALDYFKNLSLS